MKIKNVLSLFDGCSMARVALDRAGIKYENYFASEIDKYSIAIAKKNYPDTIQLGDITKWKEWNLPKIDLVVGGSPCQGFSFAGKQLNFSDERSKLFFVFVDILEAVSPNYFLLENVVMKKEYENAITEILGVCPIKINSSLVSAQNRKRLYWCNWNSSQPSNKEVHLKDVVDLGYVDRKKSHCLDANYFKGTSLAQYLKKNRRQVVFGSVRGRYLDENGRRTQKHDKVVTQRLEESSISTKTNCITTVQKENVVIWKKENGIPYRYLTLVECERLQTLPDNYTKGVSKTQRYKMLGNGFTVDVITHLFRCAAKKVRLEYQETLF